MFAICNNEQRVVATMDCQPDAKDLSSRGLTAIETEAPISIGWQYIDGDFAAQQVASLDELRNTKAIAIQAEKTRVKNNGFTVPVGEAQVLFDSDPSAQIAYLNFRMNTMADPAYVKEQWKASLGHYVRMDAALFGTVMAAEKAHTATCFAWQAARDAELAAAVTAEEISAVPTTFTTP